MIEYIYFLHYITLSYHLFFNIILKFQKKKKKKKLIKINMYYALIIND